MLVTALTICFHASLVHTVFNGFLFTCFLYVAYSSIVKGFVLCITYDSKYLILESGCTKITYVVRQSNHKLIHI